METMSVREALEAVADVYESAMPHQKEDIRRQIVKLIANVCGHFEMEVDQRIEN